MTRRSLNAWRRLDLQLRKRVRPAICRQLYRNPSREVHRSLIVAGTGRSGTTWLAEIIDSLVPCRLMFEPFNPQRVDAYSGHCYFQYMRAAEDDEVLRGFCEQILTGNIRHPWIDRRVQHLFPRYRLVKEIRINLLLKWIVDRFPDVPLVFILRHPCAVVLSRLELDWATDGDIEPFLEQAPLVEDFLAEHVDLIRGAETDEEKHAIVWCVSNLVPLQQLAPGDATVVFYEDLCEQPDVELRRICPLVGREYRPSMRKAVERPSSTTRRSSAVMSGGSRLRRWQQELNARQVSDVLGIVERFGLDGVYHSSPLPVGRPLQ